MKRFTDTDKWTCKPWFRRLPPRLKCLWAFFCETCDPAGVIAPDWEIASLQIGEEVTEADLSHFGLRTQKLENGKIWIVKFIEFQYGELSPKCRPHDRVFASIRKNRIPYPNNPDTLSDRVSKRVSNTLVEEKEDIYKDSTRKGVQGETKPPPSENREITADQIVAAYPRRRGQTEALRIVLQHLRAGDDPDAMLSGTRAIAAVIAEFPGGGNGNIYVKDADKFFHGKHWKDDPATWKRSGGKNGQVRQPTNGRIPEARELPMS
jgi:hypothetical protein